MISGASSRRSHGIVTATMPTDRCQVFEKAIRWLYITRRGHGWHGLPVLVATKKVFPAWGVGFAGRALYLSPPRCRQYGPFC